MKALFCFGWLLWLLAVHGISQTPAAAEWVEKDFPFFSSVLDCRELGEGFPKDNLTPRGLILNLGHNLWACFDTELLRFACIWEGEEGKPPITMSALAPGSYHIAGQKTKDGQEDLPKPIGKVWLANGIYPGCQLSPALSLSDPRAPTPTKEEVGRGPLADARFISVKPEATGVSLMYAIKGTVFAEHVFAMEEAGVVMVVRDLRIRLGSEQVCVAAGVGYDKSSLFQNPFAAPSKQEISRPKLRFEANATIQVSHTDGVAFVHPGTTNQDIRLKILATEQPNLTEKVAQRLYEKLTLRGGQALESQSKHWPQNLTTQATLSPKPDAYVVDDIPLPEVNPWNRKIRLADLAFLNDRGDAAAVTFDGDVWLISGLKADLEAVTWRRFASGLHEPMSLVVRNGEILVFDRTGIWKLVDSNQDKECDRYEMFCNLFAQTAETREFPNSMKLGPMGELYISKGGQEGATRGKHNGTVIKVAADGKSFEVIGYGLRQPFIGVNEQTGQVTASDQQGHYVPSTPLQIIRDHRFYGHLPTIAEPEKYPESITEPLTWIPHPVNPSGVTQTWLLGSKMGPVDGELIHIGYNRPELFRVLMNPRFEKPQAAVVSFSREFDFPTLNGAVNPADGQLYVTGFQVWGTVVKRLSGLARVRWTGKPRVMLQEVTPTEKGLVLRFNAKLDAKLATNPESYSSERWNYQRTPEYGSPHLKLDGSSGQEWMTASSAYLSADGMSVLAAFPEMKTCHQMRIGWGLKTVDGQRAENTAYFSPWELMPFDAEKFGFDPNLKVNLTPRKTVVAAAVKPTAEEGERLYQMFGCMACHSTDGTLVGKVGPSWKGLYDSEREIAKGMKGKVKADADYLRESILNPSAKVVKGFEKFDTGMPIYAGILNESQIESLILYIKSLR
jgi:glucose/arabinose dehydrogenase/cytochrome c551/c552